ncbi:hypothetical protein RHD99_19105 [Buttiauxella selenatireducens]|uniref:Uncharacterized protein n=1 Tax=Buttiauxella selenatireducens TaxID=3073902 RepID=A0ABY9SAR9_9ENTR|nr:hypothetical protein [Buttiauxella sp. R73]WMY73536.1 hypothetical protein RHD99_19105 [Buttiauxella sp. R73]
MKNLIKTAVGGLLFLTSCHAFSAASDLNVKSINVPSYNLIVDALNNMNAANGNRNDFVMQQICDLARGDKSQQDVQDVLAKNNIDPNTIPAQGALSSLMVNGDRAAQAYTCATYVATTLSQLTDNASLYDKTKDKKGNVDTKLNSAKFASEMRIKMSMAQANAQLFAVIASNLPTSGNLTWDDYQRSIARTVYNYAPEYLRLMKVLYTSDTAKYSPGTITKSTLSAADNQGRELQITPKGQVLISRGVVWLGNGKILGKEYFSPVTIIASAKPVVTESVKKVIDQEKKTEGKKIK